MKDWKLKSAPFICASLVFKIFKLKNFSMGFQNKEAIVFIEAIRSEPSQKKVIWKLPNLSIYTVKKG